MVGKLLLASPVAAAPLVIVVNVWELRILTSFM